MKKLKRIIQGALAVFIGILLYGIPVDAAGEKKIVRVGYPIQLGLTDIDEAGTRSGYSYEYLLEIAKHTNWEYEFFEAEGTLDEQLSLMLEMLGRGELDLLGGMLYNEALAELYDYPGYNYGTSYYVLCTLDKNTELTTSNYYLQPKLKTAVMSTKKVKNEKLEQFAQMSGFEAEQIFCETDVEQRKLLEEGTADVLLTKDVAMPLNGLNVLASFSPEPYYFATTKGNKDIVNELDRALDAIAETNPEFAANLWNEYFVPEREEVFFSKEEQQYIENAGVLKAAALGGRQPLQYVDAATGESQGVSLDVLAYISEQTGLEFEVVIADSFEEYEKLIMSGEIDVAVGVVDKLQQYGWQSFPATIPYLEAPIAVVLTEQLNPENIDGKRLAISEGIRYDGEYSGSAVYFETVEDCFKAVDNGSADYCYGNIYSIQYYLSNPKAGNLITVPLGNEWVMRYCMGVVDPENELLLQIMNKTIQLLTNQGHIRNYLYNNAYRQENVTFMEYLISNPFEAAVYAVVALLVFTVIILMVTRSRDKKNERIRKLENERYEQISEISNEYLFEYDYKKDMITMTEKCAEFLKAPREINNFSMQEGNDGVMSYLLEQEGSNEELVINREDGTSCWVKITTKRICDNDGRIIYLVGKMTDIQKEREEKERLKEKAEKDTLTGVYNISTFRENVIRMYGAYKTDRYVFYIIDVDYFKEINDTYGHYIGDCVLEEIGKTLMQVFSEKGDVVGRLGGDEFVAQTIYRGDEKEIEHKSELLKKLVREIDFPERQTFVTVSIGAAIIESEWDFEAVYKQADKALYEAKRTGRNHYCIYR